MISCSCEMHTACTKLCIPRVPRRILRDYCRKCLKKMSRCNGTTKAGNRCSITITSVLTNDRGRLVCEPLRRGSDFCLLHSKPFLSKPASTNASDAVVLFVDIESTGVDISRDRKTSHYGRITFANS